MWLRRRCIALHSDSNKNSWIMWRARIMSELSSCFSFVGCWTNAWTKIRLIRELSQPPLTRNQRKDHIHILARSFTQAISCRWEIDSTRLDSTTATAANKKKETSLEGRATRLCCVWFWIKIYKHICAANDWYVWVVRNGLWPKCRRFDGIRRRYCAIYWTLYALSLAFIA